MKKQSKKKAAAPPAPEPQPTIESPYLTSREAAHYLRIAPGTLRAWICKNKYPNLKVRRVGNSIRFLKSELDQFAGVVEVEVSKEKKQ